MYLMYFVTVLYYYKDIKKAKFYCFNKQYTVIVYTRINHLLFIQIKGYNIEV